MKTATYEIKKDLDGHGSIIWRLFPVGRPEDGIFYYTKRACIGHLMTKGKIMAQTTKKPGHYLLTVGLSESPAQEALGMVMK